MKKNILLVQSFLILPLLTSSLSFSMDNTPQTYSQAAQKVTRLPQPLKQSGSKKRKKKKQTAQQQELPQPTTEKADVASVQSIEPKVLVKNENAAPEKPSRIPSETTVRTNFEEVLKLILLINKTSDQQPQDYPTYTAALEASMYNPAPVVNQGLGWNDWLKSTISPKWFVLDAINQKTFDPQNADHMKSLMETAKGLALNKQSKELKTLLEACRKNYPNLELKKKLSLQIQERFKADEKNTAEEAVRNIKSESAKLFVTQQATLKKTTELITNLTTELEKNANALALAQLEYTNATHSITEKHNKAAQDARNGNEVLYKLRRDIGVNSAIPFDHMNSNYLALKTNTANHIDSLHAQVNHSLNQLMQLNGIISSTLSMLPAPQNGDLVQIDNK